MQIPVEKFPAVLSEYQKGVRRAGIFALNKIAFNARKAVLERQKQVFTLRNKWASANTRYEKATETTMAAQVYVTSKQLAGQEAGEKRSSSRDYRIPQAVYEVFGLDRKKVIPKQYRAKQLLAKPTKGVKAFASKKGIFAKVNGRTRLLWSLDPMITIEKRPYFFPPIEKEYQNLQGEFDRNLSYFVQQQLLRKIP